jgi:lipopolysaccharide/colanic/teichoic acid biosynthesis glycosyltransferase
VLLLAALLVKLSSPGPVIALEMRIGGNRRWIDRKPRVDRRRDDLGGKPFELYRFRTTYEGKVTQVGRFLRATRINELPQYGNVIRGDMNLVGPRPVSPAAFQDLRQVLRDFEHRQSVLPGITGLAQISCDPATDFEDLRRSVELDLEYVSDRSLVKDLRILTRTVRFAIRRIRIRSDK